MQANKKLLTYLQKHWFSLSIVAILAFAIFKKDFSFRINLNNPTEESVPAPAPPSRPEAAKEKPKEIYTDKGDTQQSSLLDRFDFSAFGKSATPQLEEVKAIQQLNDELKNGFIKRFAHVAITEREKFGIPAAITMANAMLHSQAGISRLSATSNNYFQLLCTADWQGETTQSEGNCYRAYENAWTSFRDHSLYITTGQFSKLRKLAPTDHVAWANELEKARFSNIPALAKQLLQLIEEYSLEELDNIY
ncbi:MAG: glucosaminidase domain-containing protein [Bacteroidota bacterium]